MNSYDELIEKIYNDHLLSVERKFSDIDLRKRFYAYMNNKHQDFLKQISSNAKLLSFMLSEWYDSELILWGHLNEDRKYSRFTPDEYLVQIINHSNAIFMTAIETANGHPLAPITFKENNNHIEQIQTLLDKVLEVNCDSARHLLSEALVDANYAAGLSKFTSFRLREWIDTHMRYSYHQE